MSGGFAAWTILEALCPSKPPHIPVNPRDCDGVLGQVATDTARVGSDVESDDLDAITRFEWLPILARAFR